MIEKRSERYLPHARVADEEKLEEIVVFTGMHG
jgi:hypothetical protein